MIDTNIMQKMLNQLRSDLIGLVRRQREKIDRLQAIVDKVWAELEGFEQLDSSEGLYETLEDIQNILSRHEAAEAVKEKPCHS